MTGRAPNTRHSQLTVLLEQKRRPDFTRLPILTPYEISNFVEGRTRHSVSVQLCPLLGYVYDYASQQIHTNRAAQPASFYPTRAGFVPKRLGM